MDLILWRHAEAVDAAEGDDDLARGLTARGERQAARMAAWLNRHLPASARILVSPAVRTQQTARALERKFRTVGALAPGASVEAVLEAARWPGSREPVMVVGHQPTLGLVASTLLTGEAQPFALRKGGFWWLRQRQRHDDEQVVLVAALSPEQL